MKVRVKSGAKREMNSVWSSTMVRNRSSLAASSARARFWAVMSRSKPPIWTIRPSPSRTGKRITRLQP